MRSSHPPALLRTAERTIAEERLFGRGDCVLVAVSGGPDSMALLHVLARLAPRFGARLSVHGVDHGLRPEAAAELALAERVATEQGVPFSSTRVSVASGPNLMARARDARRAALAAALEQFLAVERADRTCGRIATAHHADDRAETVLMRLLRGAGPEGLAALPARAGIFIRPLIRTRRRDILLHLERHHVPFASDPTNRDPRFLRTRVRGELLPRMAELSPRIVEHLCNAADDMARLFENALKAERVPPVVDGERLGRAQRASLGRAIELRNPRARVLLSGGKTATVDPCSGKIVVKRDE
jgi:tRNA(Ile)-lysidine synthase